MPAVIQVVWGGRWESGQRLTPAVINRIFEQAAFSLQGAIDAASIPVGGINSTHFSVNVVSGLNIAPPAGTDYLFGHDTSAGGPRKFLVSEVLALGFVTATSVVTLAEGDEFNVLVGGVAKKITLPLVRAELLDAPNTLTWTTVQFASDRLLIHDTSANEPKAVKAADLVRSVTDRVVTTAGTSTAYTLTTGVTLAALVTGARFVVKFHATCGINPTLNVDGLGARALRTSDGQPLSASQVSAAQILEVVYDTAANSGAGAWLLLGVTAASGRTSVVFNGSVGVAWIGLEGDVDAANDWITVTAHGLVTGEVLWYDSSVGTPAPYTPYYVIVVDANRFRLAATKAGALAGTYLQLTAQLDITANHWVTDPILAASNVDGVIRLANNKYYIDFTTPLSHSNYVICPSVEWQDSAPNYAGSVAPDSTYKARTTEGFGLFAFTVTSDNPKWISVICFP